jgi:hypothetical protein
VPEVDRSQLAQVVANGQTLQKLAVRASILLILADHVRPSHIATRVKLSPSHVHYGLLRYVAARRFHVGAAGFMMRGRSDKNFSKCRDTGCRMLPILTQARSKFLPEWKRA